MASLKPKLFCGVALGKVREAVGHSRRPRLRFYRVLTPLGRRFLRKTVRGGEVYATIIVNDGDS